MYNILMVDDEPMIVDSLYEFMVSQSIADYEYLKAYSANKALELAGHVRIDIAVLDIEMSGMNGLELGEKLKSIHSHCRIIYLTAYARFDYVYAAAQKTRTRFLLKSEGNRAVLAMIKEECYALDCELLSLAITSDQENALIQDYAKNDFLRMVLSERIDNEVIDAEMVQHQFPIDLKREIIPVLFRVIESKKAHAYFETTKHQQNLVRRFYGFFSEQYKLLKVQLSSDFILFLIQPAINTLTCFDLKQNLELFLSKVMDTGWLHISAALTDIGIQINNIHKVLDLMRTKLENMPEDDIEYICQIGCHDLDMASLMEIGDELVRLIQLNDMQTLHKAICGAKQKAEEIGVEFTQFLFHQFERVHLQHAWDEDGKGIRQLMYFAGRIENAKDEDSFARIAYEYGQCMLKNQSQHTADVRKTIIYKVDEYIKQHYSDDIGLVDIANYVYLSSPYLSRMYKKDVGKTIMDRIREVRIQNAAWLLKTTSMRIQDIAKSVGFNSTRYFNFTFRAVLGVKPTEYREGRR